MWLIFVQLNLTMGLLIVQLVSCTETEDTNSTVLICWTNDNNESHLQESRCNHCSQCPIGTYVVETCSKSKDTVCRECPAGSYSARENSSRCLRCTDCADYGMSNVTECNETKDTTCGCPEDTYSKNGSCVPCSKCPPGQQVSKTCGHHSDTECMTCRRGSFSNQENTKTYCEACHVCYRNRIEIQSCSPTTNTICGDCKEGYYKEQNTANCAKCSYCYPEFPGYTFQVDECLGLENDPNYTCMPVTVQPYVGVHEIEIDVSSVSPLQISSLTSVERTTVFVASLNHLPKIRTSVTVPIIVGIVIVSVCVFVICVFLRKKCKTKFNSDPKSTPKTELRSYCTPFPVRTDYNHLTRQKSVESEDESVKSTRHNMLPVRQQSVESGDESVKSTRHNMLPVRQQSVESGYESIKPTRHDELPVRKVRIKETVKSEVELTESNKHNLLPVRQQSVESGYESVESNRHDVRPVRDKRIIPTVVSTVNETEEISDYIQSYDSGFSSITSDFEERPGVIESGDETPKFCGFQEDLLYSHESTIIDPFLKSILYADGKPQNPAVTQIKPNDVTCV